MPGREFFRGDVRIVRRLDGKRGKKRTGPSLRLPFVFQELDEQFGQRIGFKTGKTVALDFAVRAVVPMHPAIILAVVVFVTDPGVKAAAPLARNEMEGGAPRGLLEAVEMPLAKPGRLMVVLLEGMGDGGAGIGKAMFVARDAFVRIATREQRSAGGTAERITHQCVREVHSRTGEVVDVWGGKVGIAVEAESLTAVLIAENPDDVFWS